MPCRGCVPTGEARKYPADLVCEDCALLVRQLGLIHDPNPPKERRYRGKTRTPPGPCQWEGCQEKAKGARSRFCETHHRENQNRIVRDWRKSHREAGLCQDCMEPAVPGETLCKAHKIAARLKERRYYWQRKREGK